MLAPLIPLKTYILSLATATGKLQQVGGRSPAWETSSQILGSPCKFAKADGQLKSKIQVVSGRVEVVHLITGMEVTHPLNMHLYEEKQSQEVIQ